MLQVATSDPCPCGGRCGARQLGASASSGGLQGDVGGASSLGMAFVDHWGAWYSSGGHDSYYVRDGSLPATLEREWAVADPWRCRVVGVVIIDEKTIHIPLERTSR